MKIKNKDSSSYLSNKNKIHEQIKDLVIDRFLKIIYKQNNEILLLKKKLEDTIKNSLLIIKKNFLKKKLSPANQISLSYYSNYKQNNYKQLKEHLGTLRMINLELFKDNHIFKKTAKSFSSFNNLNLKKIVNSKKKLSNKRLKIINNNNKIFNYNEFLNGTQTKRYSRNNTNKEMIFSPDKNVNNTFYADNNIKIDPINHNKKRYISLNDLDNNKNEKRKSKSKDNIIYHQNSFFAEHNYEKIKNITLHSVRGQNKIRLMNDKFIYSKRNKTNILNSFKQLNISHNLINRDSLINKIYDYSSSDKNYKIKNGNKHIITLQKDIFNTIKINNIKEKHNTIKKNSFNNNKQHPSIKLNKIILKIKDLNNNIYSTNNRIIGHKAEKTIKKINISGMNRMNTTNYFPMTDRFFNNNRNILENKSKKKVNIRKKNIYHLGDNNNFVNIKEKNYDNKTNKENSFQTMYNPTFTSFLNRK
jgi:hypothetical protein